MLIKLSATWIITLNVGGLLVIQTVLAWAFTRMPAGWFNPRSARAFEKGGAFYDRVFAIKRWKDFLPDAASWFTGGFAKANLGGTSTIYLDRFIRETWRGELCHWLAIFCVPIFFLWNPLWGDLLIFGYALAANLPCILVQRYNRIRLSHLLAQRTRRAGENPARSG